MDNKNFYNTNYIKAYLHEKRLSKNDFCKIAKISLRTLNKILKHNKSVRLKTVLKICILLKVSLNSFLNI